MREIKFRAWDKVAKRWMYPYPAGFHILGETTCFDLIGQQLHERSPDTPTLDMLNDVDIVQFTGLKDENDVEIYDGDIVHMVHGSFAVEMNDDTWQWQFSNGEPLNDGNTYGMSKRVIGNIYESPELLK